jgi:hypothetical protein
MYFEVPGEGPVPGSQISINRDFATVTVKTSLPGDYLHTRRYLRDDIDTSGLS